MAKLKAELLLNSRSRRSRELKAVLLKALDGHGIEITTLNEVSRTESMDQLLAGILQRKPGLLIAGGGDGTISDVVDRIVGSDISLGIIPLGTTNNFARSLNIPLEIDGAVRVIKEHAARPVDLGMIHDDYYTNVAGIGLSALVAHHVTDKAKRRWGRFAYTMVGIRELIRHKPFMVVIEDKDRELQLNFETHQVIIANGRYHAGKKIAIGAKVDNKELIIFSLGGRSKLSFVWSMLDFYLGQRKNVSHATYLIARNVRLRTSSPQMVELDGEVKFETPVTAKVASDAIRIRYKS